MEEKREQLKESTSTLIKHQQENLAKVQEDLKHVRQELDLAEGRKTENSDLENFMARQIEELRSELECPVCLEVATTLCADLKLPFKTSFAGFWLITGYFTL